MRDHIEIVECLEYSLLTEARGRTDFLLNTYGSNLESKWSIGQGNESAAIRTAIKNAPGETIPKKLIGYIASFDPSPNGQYTQWMVIRYLKDALKLQDLPKVKEYLTLFSTMKVKKQLPAGQADINSFQNFNDFVGGMKQYRAALLPARLEKKWKMVGSGEPQDIQNGIALLKGKTIGDNILAYLASFSPNHAYWLGITWLTNGMWLEDIEAAGDYLRTFDYMTGMGELNVDLDDVHTLNQLASLVRKPDDNQEVAVVDDGDETKMLKQAEVLIDDDEVRVVKPLTQAAACHFGRSTEWCTAWGSHVDLGLSKEGRHPQRTNRYQDYVKNGPLYIIEVKPELDNDGKVVKKRRLYQFHEETGQFTNVKDDQLSKRRVSKLLYDFPQIKEAIGDPLADIDDLYRKDGMTDRVIRKIKANLPAGLNAGSYDPENKVFAVHSWKDFESFLNSVYDDDVKKILDIALGDNDDLDINDSFIQTALELPPQWQEKLIARAGISGLSDHAIVEAARKLMNNDDEWFASFEDLYNSNDLSNAAWDRLEEYAEVGWIFIGYGVFSNIPNESGEFKKFITANKVIELYVHERDMVGYAMADSHHDDEEDGYDDDDYTDSVVRMRNEGTSADWETLDSEYMYEKRRDAGLIEDRNDDDTWLKEIEGNAPLKQLFLDTLQGTSSTTTTRIIDPRQQELKFESMRRLLVLAGILRG